MATSENALFLGNLRPDVRVGALKQNIIHMFHQLGATVYKNSIQVTSKPHTVYAFVHLASEEERDIILDLLNSANILRDLDLSDIVKEGRKFKVAPKQERWQLAGAANSVPNQNNQFLGPPQHGLKNSQGGSSQWSNSPQESAASGFGMTGKSVSDGFSKHNGHSDVQDPSACDTRKTYTKVAAKSEEHYYVKRENSVPMFQSLLKNRNYYGPSYSESDAVKCKVALSGGEKGDDELDSDEDIIISSSKKSKKKNSLRKKRLASRQSQDPETGVVDLSEIKKVNEKAVDEITKATDFFHREVYMLNERLGNEHRGLEFKRGQGEYVLRQLQDHVSIYMSAFLNTEGGTFLVGVNDDGEVKGVEVDRQLEDLLRRDMDATINRIRPTVFPSMYQLDFVQVVDSHNQPLGDRRVIELSVTPGTSGQLYQTPSGDVYVRRDGSIQGPLKAADIQEWTRMMLFEEQRKKDNEISNLREKEKKLRAELEEHRANEERLEAQLQTIEPDGKVKVKDKSKVCVIL